jgi:ribosomal protein S12 methylthiotransferase accessory factor
MTTLVDRQRATFGVKFGSHPSLSVAIERTLTEAFQDRDAQRCTDMNHLASPKSTESLDNITSMFVSGFGSLPAVALCGDAGWDVARWPSWEGAGNAEMLGFMMSLLLRDGFRPLVRDVSHLGFPSYQIVVPGMSDVFAPSVGLRKSLVAKRRTKLALEGFPQLSPDEQEHLLKLEPTDLVRTGPGIFGPPVTDGRMHPCRVFGFLHLVRGEYEEARACFETFSTLTGEMGLRYWRAMARYASCREEGMGHEEAMRIVRFLNLPDVAWHVGHEIAAAHEDLSRLFPRIDCPDCAHCELLARGGCAGLLGTYEVMERIARAMRETAVTQEPLLALLRQN